MFNNLLKLNRFIFRAMFYAIKRKGKQKEKIYRKEIAWTMDQVINS